MAESLQAVSQQWKDIKLGYLDAPAMALAEEAIYADALTYARTPSRIPEGEMRAVRRQTPNGHTVTEFVGNGHFVESFSPRAHLRRIKSIRIE